MRDVLEPSLVYVVDDDADLGASIARLLRRNGYAAEPFISPRQLLSAYEEAPAACVVTDVMMDDMDGFAFAKKMQALDPFVALVFMTAWPTIANAVDAIRNYGGLDYLDKPIKHDRLVKAVSEGVKWSERQRDYSKRLALLTKRERDVFGLLVKGFSTKEIARELGLSPRTVEDHRASITAKTDTHSVKDLVAMSGELVSGQ